MKNVCAQELAPPFSLLWPQDHKPLHRLWDLYPGFGGQGPARGLLDATTYRCNNALVFLCSDLHGFPGKIKPEQAQLLLPRPHIVITRLCVLAGTSAPSCQWTPPPPGQAVWPSTSDCPKKASQLPTASHNTSLHTGKRCLSSRE